MNRWGFRPKLGIVYPVRPKWLLKMNFDAWFYTANNKWLGAPRTQGALGSGALHVIRRFRPGFWAALDMNYFYGRKTTDSVFGELGLSNNSMIGGTLAYPLGGGHGLKVIVSTGFITVFGNDATTISVGYGYAWS